MKRLNKQDLKKRDEIQKKIGEALQKYNDAIDKARDAYTEVEASIAEGEQWREGIYDRMATYFDEKSEKWQCGDAGTTYQDWMNEWDQMLESEEPDLEFIAEEDFDLTGFPEDCP